MRLNGCKKLVLLQFNKKKMILKSLENNFFLKIEKKKIGFPKFKKKSNGQSFRLPNQKFKIIGNKIQLEKNGRVKMIINRDLPEGKLMSVTISKNPSGQFFASILIETEINYKVKTNKEVGIDLGIKTFSTQSNGLEISNPKFFNKSQVKLRRLQQHLLKKKER